MAATNLSSMFQYWKNFDLSTLQKELDTTATELANRQDESDQSRKKLVEQSREFKKNTPDEVRRAVAGLLKSFQAEVDNLSKRSKSAEASFLNIYKKLIDLPDPVPVLEHSITLQKRAQKAQDLEIENSKLRETLEEYNQEFAEVKNQEVTIKKLQDKVKEYEERMQAVASTRAQEKEQELQRLFNEKERELQEKQLNLATKLGESEQKILTLQKALETAQSELFDFKAKNEEQSAAKSDEMEMLVTDLERSNQRNTSLEKELENLKVQLQSANQSLQQAEQMQKAPNMEQAIDILSRSSLEVELSAKEKEITQLVEDVQRLQTANNKLRESTTKKIQKLEEQVTNKDAAFRKLEDKIKNQSDYEEIKRELGILKSIEFSNQEDEEDGDDHSEGSSKSLEMLLLEKNRALQTENTTLKVTKSDLTGESDGLRQAQAFASMIGQEVAAAYQQNGSSKEESIKSGSQIIQPIIVIPPGHNALSPSQFFPYGGNLPPFGNHFAPNRQLLESYHWIDTTRVAKQIKDLLTQLNIGQRLFGELVLNMSQGSVSDILARPKPWDRLTAKGREPYVKMVQFLADPRNVEQLKIMNAQRKGVDVDAITQSVSSPPPHSKSNSDDAINHILAKARQEMESQKENCSHHKNFMMDGSESKRKRKKSSVHRILPSLQTEVHVPPTVTTASALASQQVLKRPPLPPLTAAEYEENKELDTVSVIQRVKDVLEKNNIPQRVFGNFVVCMSQGSVSDLLSKTKPWDKLSLKGRDPFVRMNIWLNDPLGVEKLREKMREAESQKAVTTLLDSPQSDHNLEPQEPLSPGSPQTPSKSPGFTCESPLFGDLLPELPPVHEQAAMIEFLDTFELTRQVKTVLHENSLGQRAFGECVLGLTQGSVSDLLSKPKMWLKLSMKGREPYVRMYLWLQDKDGVEKVKNYRPRKRSRHNELQQQHNEALKTILEQKTLINQLEKDVLSINSLSTLYRGEGEGQASTSSTEADLVAKAVEESVPVQIEPAQPTGAAESLLPIVSSQRERFRLRNVELEAENRQNQQQVHVLQNEVDNLRSDNVKLYEKIKFLQSYPHSKPSSKSDDTVKRYSSQYEERLDPFTSFSRKEKQRKYMNLSPLDKATLNMGRVILSSKVARLFAFCYTMLLHMLVFLVLYKMAHISACKRDTAADCVQKFQEHMEHFHPGDMGGHGGVGG